MPHGGLHQNSVDVFELDSAIPLPRNVQAGENVVDLDVPFWAENPAAAAQQSSFGRDETDQHLDGVSVPRVDHAYVGPEFCGSFDPRHLEGW